MGLGSSNLEDRLYDKVTTLLTDDEKQHAPVIAGMLLEMGEENVQNLLKSEDLLKSAIEKSLHAYLTKQDKNENLPGQSVDNGKTDKVAVGDILFEKVKKICPDQAAKITGMLLELDRTSLENLLVSDTSLQSVVQRAQEVCTDSTCSSYNATPTTDQSPTLGNLLYEQVEKIYPDQAAKITGMILERPADQVYQIIQDEKQLLQCVQKAHEAILTSAQPLLEPT